jgi:pimeloyl-ACP methyl ester carboxylesterase
MSMLARGSADGISYLRAGSDGAFAFVLLHGIGSNADSFVPLIEAWNGRYSVVAWNAPGYGDSEPLALDWPDPSDYASALDRLLQELGIERCALVGHSLGALIAARYSLERQSRVLALILISPALGYAAAKGNPLPDAVAARINDLDRLGVEEFAAKRAPALLFEPGARTELVRSIEQAMAAIRRPGYDQAARMLAVGSLLSDATRLSVPTAVIVGSQDRITPPENARKLWDALTGSTKRCGFHELQAAGHAICQERPHEVAALLSELIEEICLLNSVGSDPTVAN